MGGVSCSVVLFKEQLQCACHGRGFGQWRFQVQTIALVLDGFGRSLAETAELHIALPEVGKVFCQRFDTTGSKENHHVVVERMFLVQYGAHRTIHHALRVVQALGIQSAVKVVLMYVTLGYQKLFFLVLGHDIDEVVPLARLAEKHFALAILYILLDIQCHLLGELNTIAVWSRMETFSALNSFAERRSTCIKGRKSICTLYFFAMSKYGDFSELGAGCDTRIFLIIYSLSF